MPLRIRLLSKQAAMPKFAVLAVICGRVSTVFKGSAYLNSSAPVAVVFFWSSQSWIISLLMLNIHEFNLVLGVENSPVMLPTQIKYLIKTNNLISLSILTNVWCRTQLYVYVVKLEDNKTIKCITSRTQKISLKKSYRGKLKLRRYIFIHISLTKVTFISR